MRTVAFYLDFVSPYTWLALSQAESFGERHGVRWDLQPVVYAALLRTHGLVGPVETPAKRAYTMRDVVRCAHELGLDVVGPPKHPFRSLEALRALTLYRREPQALSFAVALSAAAWCDGRELTDLAVIEDAAARSGLDTRDLPERIRDPQVKGALKETTDGALRRGVFGVPTFAIDDELFWGHDRMAALARRIEGERPPPPEIAARMIARPWGIDRRERERARE